MTVLTFNFSNSYRGVTHTQSYYQGLVPQLFALGDGYNNHAIAHYVSTATLHHTNGTTETLDDRDAFHPEDATAKGLGISAAAVLAHAPTSKYYELWQHEPGNPGGMALRVSAHVPAPPKWSSYVKADYFGNNETDSGYAADLQKYVAALVQWEFGEGWETSNGTVIPRTDATLRDGNHTLGTIHASSAIDPQSFLDIANFQAIVKGSQHDDTLEGGKLDDKLYGAGGKDILHGFEGNDTLDGGAGDDTLDGLDGDDRLLGGAGKDVLAGGKGNDRLEGGDDPDLVYGLKGEDRLDGGSGDDGLFGGGKDDRLDGKDGKDNLVGSFGNDSLRGGDDADTLDGDFDDDELEGGNGNDNLLGGSGLDTLRGQAGNDRLDGGRHSDDLVGGAGRDQFVFTDRNNVDEIEDFKHGGDNIVLPRSAFATIDRMNADAFHIGPHATDDEDRIIYWHHVLYYDPDGAKNGDQGSEQEAFAKVMNGATLSHSDFLLE